VTERQYGQWRVAAARNTRTAGRERESHRGAWSGYVTLPFVGVLVLGLFAFSVALFPPQRPNRDAAAPAPADTPAETTGKAVRKEADLAARKEETAKTAGEGEAAEYREKENTAEEITAVVHFSHNGTELTYEGIVELQRFAEEAAQADVAWVRVDGYGDSTGSPEANLRVSLQRAEEVVAFIQEQMPTEGVAFITAGHGSADPVADNSTVEGRARNRRIEATAGVGAPAADLPGRALPPTAAHGGADVTAPHSGGALPPGGH